MDATVIVIWIHAKKPCSSGISSIWRRAFVLKALLPEKALQEKLKLIFQAQWIVEIKSFRIDLKDAIVYELTTSEDYTPFQYPEHCVQLLKSPRIVDGRGNYFSQ